jgi:hypothetical protein
MIEGLVINGQSLVRVCWGEQVAGSVMVGYRSGEHRRVYWMQDGAYCDWYYLADLCRWLDVLRGAGHQVGGLDAARGRLLLNG